MALYIKTAPPESDITSRDETRQAISLHVLCSWPWLINVLPYDFRIMKVLEAKFVFYTNFIPVHKSCGSF